MLKGASLLAALGSLWATAAQAGEPAQLYQVAWGQKSEATRSMVEQTDRQLKAELAKRGALVVTSGRSERAIVLMPKLEVSNDAISLSLVKVGADKSLVGSVKAKVAGRAGDAKLRALVERAVDEAARL